MKDSDRLRLEKETILREWQILWEKILVYEKQIDTIKNWCIVTLVALFGFLLKFGSEIIEKYQMAFLLPVFLISFFALNELFKQTWKWEAFERLYDMENLLQEKFEYRPFFLTYCVRKRLEIQKGTKSSEMESNTLRNSLFARNFAFFYGLLFFSCSVFFLWTTYAVTSYIAIIFLCLGILSISWMFFSVQALLTYETERDQKAIMITVIVFCIIFLVILFMGYLNLIQPLFL